MKKETLQTIVKVLNNAASKDATRHHLNCVKICSKYIEATDGHLLVSIEHNDAALVDVGEAFIHRDMLPQLKVILKSAHKYSETLASEISAGLVKVEGIQLTIKTDFKYPDLNQFKRVNNDGLKIGLNADYLLLVADAIKTNKLPTVKLEFKGVYEVRGEDKVLVGIDGLSPITVTSGDGKLGVVMPCRI